MQASVRPADVLLFQCDHCWSELSVPLAQQGVVGPCPCCAGRIQAPIAPTPLFLPPLDGAHEAHTAPVLPLHWLHPAHALASAEEENPPSQRLGMGDLLLPRQLTDHESLGFRAKLSIPQSDEPLDDSWRARHLEDRRRSQSIQKLDQTAEQIFASKTWKVVRTGIIVATGGLCAGLAIYLQDRNWVLDLPWRPGPAETIVTTPVVLPAARTRAIEPADPFIVEDPSELETVSRPAFLPVPEAHSLPVSAAPIASGKK